MTAYYVMGEVEVECTVKTRVGAFVTTFGEVVVMAGVGAFFGRWRDRMECILWLAVEDQSWWLGQGLWRRQHGWAQGARLRKDGRSGSLIKCSLLCFQSRSQIDDLRKISHCFMTTESMASDQY